MTLTGNYIKPAYCDHCLLTFYFQVQFIKVHCSFSAKHTIRMQFTFGCQKRKYYEDLEKKRKVVKKNIMITTYLKQYRKRKHLIYPTPKIKY